MSVHLHSLKTCDKFTTRAFPTSAAPVIVLFLSRGSALYRDRMRATKTQTGQKMLARSQSCLLFRIIAIPRPMKTCALGFSKAVLGAAFLALALPLCAQPNSWTSPGTGYWQDAFTWSAGAPNGFQSMFITNVVVQTVLI